MSPNLDTPTRVIEKLLFGEYEYIQYVSGLYNIVLVIPQHATNHHCISKKLFYLMYVDVWKMMHTHRG